MKREDITLDQVRKAFAYMDYAFFTTGDYNLNIFGIRNKNLQTDTFNDYICLAYRVIQVLHIERDVSIVGELLLCSQDSTKVLTV